MCKSMQRFLEELKSFEREQKSAEFFFKTITYAFLLLIMVDF